MRHLVSATHALGLSSTVQLPLLLFLLPQVLGLIRILREVRRQQGHHGVGVKIAGVEVVLSQWRPPTTRTIRPASSPCPSTRRLVEERERRGANAISDIQTPLIKVFSLLTRPTVCLFEIFEICSKK
jgi:hypothetical protein